MKLNYKVTGESRKQMVAVISQEAGIQPVYTRMPECAFLIGNIKVSRTGELMWDERTDEKLIERIMEALSTAGFSAEEATETHQAEDESTDGATETQGAGAPETTGLIISFPLDGGMIAFTNNIGQTDITVRKVDAGMASDAADRFIGNAVFSIYDSAGHNVSGITITDLNTGAVITPDAENKFKIPITGIKISGLADGSYQLVERAAPAGYIIADDATTFTVSQGTVTSWSLSGAAAAAFEIPNPRGAELPAAGGFGTSVFTLTGLLLMMFAGVWILMRSRKTA